MLEDLPSIPWIAAFTVALAVVLVAGLWAVRSRGAPSKPLPSEWSLAPRPVFSTEERRIYRQLREALPHHVILSKLPLVRFCQPNDPDEVRYWYDLLGSIHVTFAICSANGRVLAAIDLDNDRGASRRAMQIKQSVLGACRIRYLRCPLDHVPSVPELQLLVPHSSPTRAPQPAPAHSAHDARDSLASTVANRRAKRTALWQDSSFFQDSFFAPDTRGDDSFGASDAGHSAGAAPNSAPGSLRSANGIGGAESSRPSSQADSDEIAGVVVDSPRYSSTRH